GRDVEAAHEERLEQERDEECDHQDHDQIPEESEYPAAAPPRFARRFVHLACPLRCSRAMSRTSPSCHSHPGKEETPAEAGVPPEERGSEVALLLDLGLLAGETAQVVQLGATHVTAGHDLDLVDRGRV